MTIKVEQMDEIPEMTDEQSILNEQINDFVFWIKDDETPETD